MCKNNTTTTVSCTGTRPANSTILANVGNTSRTWTYDGSPTGPYQSCSFKCQSGYSYNNNTCTPTQTTSTPVYTCTDSDGGADYYKNGLITQIQNGKPSTLNDSCAQDNIGELTEYYCMADGSG